MLPAHGNGRYYEEDFENDGRLVLRIDRWGMASIALALVIALLAAAHFGGWWQRRLDRQGAVRAIAQFPGCRACDAVFPQTKWLCTPQESRDRADACAGPRCHGRTQTETERVTMNAVVASAPAGAPEVRSLDVLWREAIALHPNKLAIEAPGFLTGGKIEVNMRFDVPGSDSSLRLVAKGEDVRQALEDVLAQAARFGKRP